MIASSDGFLYQQNQSGASDAGSAIPISWQTKAYCGQNPKAEKFWGKPTVYLKKQGATAGAITVTPQVGDYGVPAQAAMSLTQREDQVELDRLGEGRIAQLTFTHAIDGEDVDIHGLEMPFSYTGTRPNPRV